MGPSLTDRTDDTMATHLNITVDGNTILVNGTDTSRVIAT